MPEDGETGRRAPQTDAPIERMGPPRARRYILSASHRLIVIGSQGTGNLETLGIAFTVALGALDGSLTGE